MFEVVYEDPGQLRRTRWKFYLHGTILRLTHYIIEERKTKRHKFKQVDIWNVYENRHNNTIPKPILPSEVASQVMRQVTESLRIEVGFPDE